MQRMLDSTLKCRNGLVKVIPRESGPDVTYGLTCYNVQGYMMSTTGTTTTPIEQVSSHLSVGTRPLVLALYWG